MNKTEEAIKVMRRWRKYAPDYIQKDIDHLISVAERGMDKDKLLEEISDVHSGNRTEGIKIIDRITNYIGGE